MSSRLRASLYRSPSFHALTLPYIVIQCAMEGGGRLFEKSDPNKQSYPSKITDKLIGNPSESSFRMTVEQTASLPHDRVSAVLSKPAVTVSFSQSYKYCSVHSLCHCSQFSVTCVTNIYFIQFWRQNIPVVIV